MAFKKEGLERVGLRLPVEVKDWYMRESLSLGMTMSQYMSYILVTFQRNQENVQAMKMLTELSKSPEVQEANKEVLELIKSPEFKEAMKQYQTEICSNEPQKLK